MFPGRVMTWETLTASAAINFLALALPLTLIQIYDRIIPNQSVATLTLLILGLLAAIVLETALRIARASVAGWIGIQREHRVSLDAFSRLLRADMTVLERSSPGAHLDRFASIERMRENATSDSAFALADAPFILLFLVCLYLLSPLLALVPLVLLAAWYAVALMLDGMGRMAEKARSESEARRFSFVIEVIRAIEMVKGFGLERMMERRHERLMSATSGAAEQLALQANLQHGLGGVVAQTTTVGVAIMGALLVMDESLSVGALAAAILLAGRVVQPVLRLQSALGRRSRDGLHRERARELFALPAEASGTGMAGPLETVSLEGIAFGGEPDGPALLSNVNLDIRFGETIAITGPNGSGKTSLLWLLFGALKPHAGLLRVNGRPVADIDLAAVRRQIAFMPQRPVLLTGSVLDNLTRFDHAAHLDEALELAAALGLDDFFATRVDALSAQLGGGEQLELPVSVVQRICIVRALVGGPRLILFDDANAGLDRTADERLRRLMKRYRGRAAIVLVTHRPSYIALAERAFIIRDGALEAVPPGSGARP